MGGGGGERDTIPLHNLNRAFARHTSGRYAQHLEGEGAERPRGVDEAGEGGARESHQIRRGSFVDGHGFHFRHSHGAQAQRAFFSKDGAFPVYQAPGDNPARIHRKPMADLPIGQELGRLYRDAHCAGRDGEGVEIGQLEDVAGAKLLAGQLARGGEREGGGLRQRHVNDAHFAALLNLHMYRTRLHFSADQHQEGRAEQEVEAEETPGGVGDGGTARGDLLGGAHGPQGEAAALLEEAPAPLGRGFARDRVADVRFTDEDAGPRFFGGP